MFCNIIEFGTWEFTNIYFMKYSKYLIHFPKIYSLHFKMCEYKERKSQFLSIIIFDLWISLSIYRQCKNEIKL